MIFNKKLILLLVVLINVFLFQHQVKGNGIRKYGFDLDSNFSGSDNIQNFPMDTIKISGVLSKDINNLYHPEENNSFSISTSDLKFSVLDGSEPSL